eukprot:NODE_6101_length_606_cov_37.141831_g5696_i0.p3 GENE.NODE_6101_length_606_cov_37.141831_g5696_i0~~NODE_6101_length_606_cov_37.141831_g5696_i0.p3  ORF type:complete len:118 (-),score=11.13 NODE_6101_length_606_cov_37.141831_g5696_i0:93-446(-)
MCVQGEQRGAKGDKKKEGCVKELCGMARREKIKIGTPDRRQREKKNFGERERESSSSKEEERESVYSWCMCKQASVLVRVRTRWHELNPVHRKGFLFLSSSLSLFLSFSLDPIPLTH